MEKAMENSITAVRIWKIIAAAKKLLKVVIVKL